MKKLVVCFALLPALGGSSVGSGAERAGAQAASSLVPQHQGLRGATGQLCRARRGGLNQFLITWMPNPAGIGRQLEAVPGTYTAQPASQIVQLYRDHNEIAALVRRHFSGDDVDQLRTAYRQAFDLAERVARLRPRAVRTATQPHATGNEIEYEAPSLALHTAYLVLAKDNDFRSFGSRVEDILALDKAIAHDFRFREDGTPTAIGEPPRLSGLAIGSGRAILIYRLLIGDRAAAERTMLFIIEQHAAVDPTASYAPYGAQEISSVLRSNALPLDNLVLQRLPGGSIDGCSDLSALYVEWIDIVSRVSSFLGDETLAATVLEKILRLRSDAPTGWLATRYLDQLTLIERRHARAARNNDARD